MTKLGFLTASYLASLNASSSSKNAVNKKNLRKSIQQSFKKLASSTPLSSERDCMIKFMQCVKSKLYKYDQERFRCALGVSCNSCKKEIKFCLARYYLMPFPKFWWFWKNYYIKHVLFFNINSTKTETKRNEKFNWKDHKWQLLQECSWGMMNLLDCTKCKKWILTSNAKSLPEMNFWELFYVWPKFVAYAQKSEPQKFVLVRLWQIAF